jgi:hypothetical protein
MNKRSFILLFAIVATTFCATSAQAQRRGAVASASGSRARIVRGRRAHQFPIGSAFASDYSDFDSEPGWVKAPLPPIGLSPAAQQVPPAPLPNPPESLVLELQGDHWVRITNYGRSQTTGPDSIPNVESGSMRPDVPRQASITKPPAPLPRAMLVFRDGHQEEIGKYLIAGTTLYAGADYWSSGSWTRKVQIAELDVPATLKVNQERGTKFSLPSGPNQVIIRP